MQILLVTSCKENNACWLQEKQVEFHFVCVNMNMVWNDLIIYVIRRWLKV